jgi:hypothetical protein
MPVWAVLARECDIGKKEPFRGSGIDLASLLRSARIARLPKDKRQPLREFEN